MTRLPIVASLKQLSESYAKLPRTALIADDAAVTIDALYEALVYVRENLGDPVPIGRKHVARKVDAALVKARGQQ